MKVARLLFVCFMLISLTTCTKDESLAEANHPSPNEVNSLVGSLFIKQMRSQIGSSECFTRSLGGTPLYEYTILAVGYNWGLHYAIPYTDEKGIINGCLIFPVDESLPIEEKNPEGTLGTPIRLDETLLAQTPITSLYVCMAPFLNWKNKGLTVKSYLIDKAELLEKCVQIVDDENSQTRSSVSNISGNSWEKGDIANITLQIYSEAIVDADSQGYNYRIVSLKRIETLMYDRFRNPEKPDFIAYSQRYNHYQNESRGGISKAEIQFFRVIHGLAIQQEIDDFLRYLINREYRNFYLSIQYSYQMRHGMFYRGEPSKPGGGGTSTGGTSTGGSSNNGETSSPKTPNTDKIVEDTSGLTPEQLGKLEDALSELNNKFCFAGKVIDYLAEKNYKYTSVKIDPTMFGSAGAGILWKDGKVVGVNLKFQTKEDIDFQSVGHELIHLLQVEQGVYSGQEVRGMMEYERVLIDDILYYAHVTTERLFFGVNGGSWGCISDEKKDEWKSLSKEYNSWLKETISKGLPESISADDFKKWADLFAISKNGYPADGGYHYNIDYTPKALQKVLNLSKGCIK